MQLRVKILDERARLPRRAHPNDAGLDLTPLGSWFIWPGQTKKFKTGIAVAIHPGHFGLLVGRSSTKMRGLDIITSVIDADYRGDVAIVVTNASRDVQRVVQGEFVAQLIILPCETPDLVIVDELSETERGDKGFGSTDNKETL